MPDHAGNFVVDELLRHDRALLGIGLIVLGIQLELDLLAIDRDALRVGVVDSQAGTILVVLAKVSLWAGCRADMPDLDGHFRHGGCGGRGRRRGLLRFFLAAAVRGQQGRSDEREPERAVECHEFSSQKG